MPVPQIIGDGAYWDTCTLNGTLFTHINTLQGACCRPLLAVLSIVTRTMCPCACVAGMWTTQVVTATVVLAVVYGLAGLLTVILFFRSKRMLLFVPAAYVAVGALRGFVLSSVIAFLLSEMYLSMPFSLEDDIAYSLGVFEAIFIAYMHMGREYTKFSTPPLSRFAE